MASHSTQAAAYAYPSASPRLLGRGWIILVAALAAHVTDEALTGFLSVYNPTVLAIREFFPAFPMPVFTFRVWLWGLIGLVIVLLLLSPFALRGDRWIRYIAWPFAFIMLFNAAGHTLGTVLGHTVASVHFARPMPGFYSSPPLAAASLFLMWSLKKTARAKARP